MGRTSLTLEDFADTDLFFALEDVAGGPDGWATSEEIARQIGLEGDLPQSNVGIRLGWMHRYGFTEKRKKDGREMVPTQWRLNDKGYDLLHPERLPRSVEKALATLDEGQRAQVTDAVMREMPRGSRQAAHLGRRMFRHHMSGWRDSRITPKKKIA